MRALPTTDEDGHFWYRSITPRYYPVPTDGPCGEIMRASNRSVMRPQHVHFWIHAEGYEPLITQVFLADDPYIDSDAVFAAEDALQADFVHHQPGVAPDDTFAAAHDVLGDAAVTELLMIISCYFGLALVLNAAELDVDVTARLQVNGKLS